MDKGIPSQKVNWEVFCLFLFCLIVVIVLGGFFVCWFVLVLQVAIDMKHKVVFFSFSYREPQQHLVSK